MKGDFSRFTHKPEKHYTSVLKQQGRVDLDADWNEEASIQEYLNEEGLKDMIGPTGVPSRFSGFKIPKNLIDNKYINFYIYPGRIYVDGILCELEKRSTYISQPDLPHPEKIEPASGPRIDLIYLDVWKRHITAIEDVSIRETALGGPDTATRVKTIWQVKVLKNISYDHETGSDLCNISEWNDLTSPAWGETGWGKISVKLSASKPEEKPCTIDSEGGYRGRENRLYRVEIHRGGIIRAGSASNSDTQPTFKWSRDNGAVVFPIQERDSLDARRLKLKRLGKDQFLSLHKGDWVEVLDDAIELAGEPGIMAEVTEDIDEEQLIITLGKEVSDIDITGGHAKLRRWDQMEDAIRIIPGTPVDLEAGLQVQFSTGKVKTGDFWIFTARSNGEVELLNQVPAMGIEHHYCILALIIWKNDGSELKSEVLDCRRTFPSLTDLTCLYYVGGDGQEAMPGDMLKQPIQVGISNGSQPLKGPQVMGMNVEFKIIDGDDESKLSGSIEETPGSKSKIIPVGKDGIAKCHWKLGKEPISQKVVARLIDACGKHVHLPIFFNAGFKAIGGSGCYIPVGGQSAYKELADALNALVIKNSDVCLCLLPGNYTLPEDGWTLDRQNARVKIVGSGLGSVIDLKKTTMLMKRLASISLKDLKIDAGNLNHDGLVLENCGQIDIESCCLTGDAAAANPCIVLQNKDPTTKIEKGEDIRLMPGVYIKRAGSDDLRFYIYKLIDQPGVYRIRGAAAGTVNDMSNLKESSFTWNPQNFAGFFYDIDEDIGTETLTATIAQGNKLNIEYKTHIRTKKFKFDDWGSFSVIGFLAEEYFAGYLDTPETDDDILFEESDDKNVFSDEQLLKILIDNDDERTITSRVPLELKEGYQLAIGDIDIDGNKVHLELHKGGQVVDSKVISPSKDGATMKDKTYYYKKDIGDSKDVVIVAAHFKNAFRGADQNLATIDGLWQLSDEQRDVSENTEYDKMTIQTVTANSITMNNEDNDITLNKNEDVSLMPGVSIKTADALRFYIYKEIIIEGEEPQEYKIRGAVAGIVNGESNLKNNSFTWNPQNFAGFFYDIDADAGTEMLTAAINEKNELSVKYETCSYTRKFEFENWGSYSAIGFLAEPYFAGYLDTPRTDDDILFEESDDENVLSDEQLLQILIDNDDERTVTSGTPLAMEEGYELAIQSIDIDGNKVYLELHKDGEVVDSKVISPSKDGASMTDKTYYYKKDIGDSKDVVIIAAHFKNAFRGADTNLATVDGLWQLSDTPKDVSEGTEYDQLKIISKLQANGALLKISNAGSIQIENNDIEVKCISVAAKPKIIIDEKAFPELNEVVKERGSVGFDSVASAFIENLKSMSSSYKIEFGSRLEKAIKRNETAMKRIDLGRYNTLMEATKEDDISKEKVIDALSDILAYEADEISLASALVISDAKADTIIDKNRIEGTISIYGIPTSRELNQDDLKKFEDKSLIFTGPGKVLHLRGNQMGRLVIGDLMTERIINGSEKIFGAFQSSFFSENVIKSANNQIVSDHLSFCTNVFESDKQDAGMAISNSAIFMGNYARDKIKLFSLSKLLNKDAGNLVLQIQPVP